MLRSSIVAARTKLETLAAETGSPLADFGTTLLVCCADTQSNWLGVASIGDGAIVLRQHDGTLDLIQPTRQSEYLNETDFVTSLRGLEHILLDVRPLEQVNAIAVFTDGVEWAAIKFKERTPHAAFFQPLFSHVANQAVTAADLDEFLGSERFCQQTDDDKTLVIAVRGDAVKHDAMSI